MAGREAQVAGAVAEAGEVRAASDRRMEGMGQTVRMAATVGMGLKGRADSSPLPTILKSDRFSAPSTCRAATAPGHSTRKLPSAHCGNGCLRQIWEYHHQCASMPVAFHR